MIDPIQIRMALAALRWSTQDLANATGLHVNTVQRAHAGKGASLGTLALIRNALEAEGVRFVEADDSRGVMLPRESPSP